MIDMVDLSVPTKPLPIDWNAESKSTGHLPFPVSTQTESERTDVPFPIFSFGVFSSWTMIDDEPSQCLYVGPPNRIPLVAGHYDRDRFPSSDTGELDRQLVLDLFDPSIDDAEGGEAFIQRHIVLALAPEVTAAGMDADELARRSAEAQSDGEHRLTGGIDSGEETLNNLMRYAFARLTTCLVQWM
jgi:hypothetical protein